VNRNERTWIRWLDEAKRRFALACDSFTPGTAHASVFSTTNRPSAISAELPSAAARPTAFFAATALVVAVKRVRRVMSRWLVAMGCLWFLYTAAALPARFGDLDQDGQPTVLDVVRLLNHVRNLQPLRSDFVPFADVNQDGAINDADVEMLIQAVLGRTNLPPVLDSDSDGLPDVLEPLLGLNPDLPDSDSNGVPDGEEDFDHDWLLNATEVTVGTNPMDPDTDHDGWLDTAEVDAGSNPLDPRSRPQWVVVAQPAVSVALTGQEQGISPTSGIIAQPLVMVALPGQEEEVSPTSGIVAQPLVMIVLPGQEEGISPTSGIVAQPLVMVALPGQEEEVSPTSGIVAQPLVMVALPGQEEEVSPATGIVAQPLVMVALPGQEEGISPTSGIVAQPLVKILLETNQFGYRIERLSKERTPGKAQ